MMVFLVLLQNCFFFQKKSPMFSLMDCSTIQLLEFLRNKKERHFRLFFGRTWFSFEKWKFFPCVVFLMSAGGISSVLDSIYWSSGASAEKLRWCISYTRGEKPWLVVEKSRMFLLELLIETGFLIDWLMDLVIRLYFNYSMPEVSGMLHSWFVAVSFSE